MNVYAQQTVDNSKVPLVILAGGLGTRMGQLTEDLPKPMLEIHGVPMLLHIMLHYAKFGTNEFHILGGYKSSAIKNYFENLTLNTSSISITYDPDGRSIVNRIASQNEMKGWKVFIHETGFHTGTGERLRRVRSFLPDIFYFTYGDGLSDFDPTTGLSLLSEASACAVICAVSKKERFGNLTVEKDGSVIDFQEKRSEQLSWINGGFMCLSRDVIEYITGGNDSFELDVLPRLVQAAKVLAIRHYGFWTALDNERELKAINSCEQLPWINGY